MSDVTLAQHLRSPLPVYYLGDSHVRYFRRADRLGLLMPHEVSGIEVGGATAVGMRNPNAIGRFREWIRDKPRESIITIHLGEVDCGFVIWYRAAKYDESVDSQMNQSIEAYFEFVDELLDAGFERIIVTAATLPTITDNDQVGEVAIKRGSITATQLQRTELTLRYNRLLEENALHRGLPFADISSHVLDPLTGLVDNRMRNPNPEDHHMRGNLAAVYWAQELQAAIATYDAPRLESREWVCTRDTFAKAYPSHSHSMPADMLRGIEVGEVIKANLVGVLGEYQVVKNVVIGGFEYPRLRLLHANHYTTRVA